MTAPITGASVDRLDTWTSADSGFDDTFGNCPRLLEERADLVVSQTVGFLAEKYVHFAGPKSFVMSQLQTSLGRVARSSGAA